MLPFSLILCCVSLATAWIIDDSCDDSTAPKDVVKQALASAFSQANAGNVAINQDPQDENYAALQKLLFPDEPGWDRVKEVLGNIVGLDHEGTDRKSKDEIIIYCDLRRITKNADDELWDPDIELPLADTDGYETCKSSADSFTKLAKGSTLAYVTGLSSNRNDDHVQQVQICAWYAKLMAKAQYKVGGRFTLFRLAAKIASWAATTFKADITIMDSLSLLDNTLLHELTHTRSGGGTTDIGGPNTAYGWKSISNDMIGGSNNADSIAYFALGCDLINGGSAPQKDGKLKACNIPAGIRPSQEVAPEDGGPDPANPKKRRWMAEYRKSSYWSM